MSTPTPLVPELNVSTHGTLPTGETIRLFTLVNARGHTVSLSEYGATIVDVIVPDRNGSLGDVNLGYPTLDGYLGKGNPYFGCTIGRFGNRIAEGKFTLDGQTYQLACNNGVNHLHGGPQGFDKQVWKGEQHGANSVKFSRVSFDGEEGYPGTVTLELIFTWTDASDLRLAYKATTDKATIINLTNHAYFNLSAQPGSKILDHVVRIESDRYVPVSEKLIPTGELLSVEGTPMDFRKPAEIGSRITQVGVDPIGYDHCYVLGVTSGSPRLAAEVVHPASGRRLQVLTTEPGIQLYTGNFLTGVDTGKVSARYAQHTGFCLETQHYPDSINQPTFPTVILRPGETFQSTTVFAFDVV